MPSNGNPMGLSARLCPLWAAMAVTPLRLSTRTGVWRSMVVPSPSWPTPFRPQVQTVPSLLSATLWLAPAATAVIPPRFCPCTDVWRSVMVPSPRSPNMFRPQVQTVPSLLSARLWPCPSAVLIRSYPHLGEDLHSILPWVGLVLSQPLV